ncbi:MAG: RidA family protein [Spirochaetales bacterium]|nr:RidA family protein [Spirochaetales bacterium]
MSSTVVATKAAPAAIGPYSQAVKTGSLVFCSGQLGLDPATGELADGVRAQAQRSMNNLKAVAEAAGGSLDSIVKTTIFLKDMADFAVVNEVYGSFFSGDKPARSTVAVAALPKGGLVEIEAILSL